MMHRYRSNTTISPSNQNQIVPSTSTSFQEALITEKQNNDTTTQKNNIMPNANSDHFNPTRQRRSHNILAWQTSNDPSYVRKTNVRERQAIDAIARGKPLIKHNTIHNVEFDNVDHSTFNKPQPSPKASQVAPYATSNNILSTDLSKQETALSQLSYEKEKLERDLFKLPENPRTLIERKKKKSIESQINSLEIEIKELKRFIKQHSKP